jgi:hypothetical protein
MYDFMLESFENNILLHTIGPQAQHKYMNV